MSNNTPTREEIISIVDDVNNMFEEVTYKDYLDLDGITVAIYEEAHDQKMIKLLGNVVWDSDNDPRPYSNLDLDCELRQDLKDFIHSYLKTLVKGLDLLVNYGSTTDKN